MAVVKTSPTLFLYVGIEISAGSKMCAQSRRRFIASYAVSINIAIVERIFWPRGIHEAWQSSKLASFFRLFRDCFRTNKKV